MTYWSLWIVGAGYALYYYLGRRHGRAKAERAFDARWSTYVAFQLVIAESMIASVKRDTERFTKRPSTANERAN